MVMNETSSIELVKQMGLRARCSAAGLIASKSAMRTNSLLRMSDAIDNSRKFVLDENSKDLKLGRAKDLSEAMLDRLTLDEKRIDGMVMGLRTVADLPDPIGEIYEMRTMPNELKIGKMRVPIGVIGIIYESRPNVTAEAAALCLKSSNACILRGGSEAIHSNKAIAKIMIEQLEPSGLPGHCIQLVPTTDREVVQILCGEPRAIDVIIPRGGKGLIRTVMEFAKVPVIKHLDGNCHVYIDRDADLDMASEIVINGKTQRIGVCNATESLLLDENLPKEYIICLLEKLLSLRVELRGCPKAIELLSDIKKAEESDWSEEYLDKKLSVKIVSDINEAIFHINHYGSHHTDAIVCKDIEKCNRFVVQIDSACVHVNCSTRFSDGGEYGLGCEIGISTDKLHARGPMGVRELTTSKWVVLGNGQVRR